ncbi:MAG TPA: citrate/2-methylcitrate synthase [Brevundimonas sp.]|uniref:citrate/2-methylcitrate synthase n=1 Tax=Brevundimonas sp. TaxID=1871086 RepID=UPI002BDD2057|nr:citrate/2-methylcitrate synthase [Brevundimonas sp.]HRH19933.1 citrate/2-methylcitrate synthase [Brevundimonas sp.]
MTSDREDWIGRAEAEALLGVKSQTLYAYVSRGHLEARPDPSHSRRSLYSTADLLRLKDPSSPRVARPQVERAPGVTITSGLTSVDADGVSFRGQDAVALSQTATLEQVARLVWGGTADDPFADQRPRVDVIFPGTPRSRAFACLARRADEDGPTSGRSPVSLRREAASILNEIVDAIAGPGPRLHIHQRLARAWKLTEVSSPILRQAMILSIDHQADAAVLAARVTADAGASLAASTLSGLAAFSGPELGGRLSLVNNFVIEARKTDARSACRARLAEGQALPGFEDGPHPGGDPRARALIEAAHLSEPLADIAHVGEAMTGRAPSLAMAICLATRNLDLPRDAAFALMSVGRCVGWLAHAMEQTGSSSHFQPTLRYVGTGSDAA